MIGALVALFYSVITLIGALSAFVFVQGMGPKL